MVARAAAQAAGHEERESKCFHGSGDAVASGVGEAEGAGGAVVLSGVNEAGGGSDSSASGGGSGATSDGDVCIIDGASLELRLFSDSLFGGGRTEPFGFFAVAAVTDAGWSAASPTFARN